MTQARIEVELPVPHPAQLKLVDSRSLYTIAVCSRQSGKTVGAALMASEEFLDGGIARYFAPSTDQTDVFWREVKKNFAPLIDAGIVRVNDQKRIISRVDDPDVLLRATTGATADLKRGDKATLIIYDEWQLQNEEMFTSVGLPMLTTTGGRCVFLLTPPSIYSERKSLAADRFHAQKLWERVADDPDWSRVTWTWRDNPYADRDIIRTARKEMGPVRFQIEYEARFIDEHPNALWKRGLLEYAEINSDQLLCVVGVDPNVSEGNNACGIVVASYCEDGNYYVQADLSLSAGPSEWGQVVVDAYHGYGAATVVAEINQGGDLVESLIQGIDPSVPVISVRATKGKLKRAEPVVAKYERGIVYHCETFPELEDQMIRYTPLSKMDVGNLDAMVWALTYLIDEVGIYAEDLEAYVI